MKKLKIAVSVLSAIAIAIITYCAYVGGKEVPKAKAIPINTWDLFVRAWPSGLTNAELFDAGTWVSIMDANTHQVVNHENGIFDAIYQGQTYMTVSGTYYDNIGVQHAIGPANCNLPSADRHIHLSIDYSTVAPFFQINKLWSGP